MPAMNTPLPKSFTGNAVAHANANDITDLTVTLGNADFTGNNAVAITGATKADLTIDFADPANRAPTLSGVPTTAQAVTVGTAAALDNFMVADTEQGATSLSVTLSAANGVINGLGDSDPASAGIQLFGSAATINSALAVAAFTATAAGAASLSATQVTNLTQTLRQQQALFTTFYANIPHQWFFSTENRSVVGFDVQTLQTM